MTKLSLLSHEKALIESYRSLGFYRIDTLQNMTGDKPNIISHNEVFEDLVNVLGKYIGTLPIEHIRNLFFNATEICASFFTGNFVQYSLNRDINTIVLAYVIKRYSTKRHLLFRVNTRFGNPRKDDFVPHNNLSSDLFQTLAKALELENILSTTTDEIAQALNNDHLLIGAILFLHFSSYSIDIKEYINLVSRQFSPGASIFVELGHQKFCESKDMFPLADLSYHFRSNTGVVLRNGLSDERDLNIHLSHKEITDFKRIEDELKDVPSQMSVNERFQLYYSASSLAVKMSGNNSKALRFIEIGSYAGASLLVTYKAFKLYSIAVQGFVIEPYGQEPLFNFVNRNKHELELLRMMSHEASVILKQQFEREQHFASFILIDGNHSVEAVKQDIEDFFPLLEEGGLILLHDYLPAIDGNNRSAIMIHYAGKEPGVRAACEDLLDSHHSVQLIELPIFSVSDLTQSQPYLPIIPNVKSTIRAYIKLRKTKPPIPDLGRKR